MDFKIKGYEKFTGEFLSIEIKISQKILDILDDDDKINLRNDCSGFIANQYEFLKYYANQIVETKPEIKPETKPEIKSASSL